MSVSALPLIAILGVMACIAVAVVVIVVIFASWRRAESTLPRCGNCGYNLTGAPSNGCPECGKLFVEAGVITRQLHRLPSRRVIRVVMLVLVGFTGLAVLGGIAAITTLHRAVSASQRAAIQARMQQQAAARQAATTAPVAEERPADRPSEAP